jgi:hypothetical protein
MNIKTIFHRQHRKIVLIHRISSRLRMAEWKSSKDLVTSARKFLNNPEFMTLVDVLRNESPINWITVGPMTIEDRAVTQARIEGYQLALNNLESLGMFEVPKEEIQETFEQPEELETS